MAGATGSCDPLVSLSLPGSSMFTLARPLVLVLCNVLAAPVGAEGWWLESQQGDVLRIVPQLATTGNRPDGHLFLCLRDLTGTGRKGFSLAPGTAPQFVVEAGMSTCAGTVARPLVVYLWRETRSGLSERLRLPLRAEHLRGHGLRIDWLAD